MHAGAERLQPLRLVLDKLLLHGCGYEASCAGRDEGQNVDNRQTCTATRSEVSRIHQRGLFSSHGVNVYEHTG
jgi:hypothetical protein